MDTPFNQHAKTGKSAAPLFLVWIWSGRTYETLHKSSKVTDFTA